MMFETFKLLFVNNYVSKNHSRQVEVLGNYYDYDEGCHFYIVSFIDGMCRDTNGNKAIILPEYNLTHARSQLD